MESQKTRYLEKNGWVILEVWENEVNNNSYEKDLLCSLSKLKVFPK
jgi:very-short-patch-repair endonuclease